MGLIHAATAYDPTRGASFKTFAYTAIRGAVLDEIRKHDPVPRSRRDRLRNLERAAARLRTELNRQPTVEEIAESMGTSAESLDSDLLALHTCRILSLDDFSSSGNGELLDFRLGSVNGDTISPAEKAITKEQIGRLAKAISELPESERNVIVLYHYENLYLKEIGEILGVSESRISQVLSRATARLKMKMKEE
jgi:RNA polymerase sigma factor for flagellar operon FliA